MLDPVGPGWERTSRGARQRVRLPAAEVATQRFRTARASHATSLAVSPIGPTPRRRDLDEALAMLGDASYDESRLLGAFTYTSNRAVLHRDPALMPRRRRVWSSWNYISRQADDRRPRVCVTYWMNALQGLDPRVPLFVTLNPCREPAPDLVEGTFHYDHPTYHRAALRAQRELVPQELLFSLLVSQGRVRE